MRGGGPRVSRGRSRIVMIVMSVQEVLWSRARAKQASEMRGRSIEEEAEDDTADRDEGEKQSVR